MTRRAAHGLSLLAIWSLSGCAAPTGAGQSAAPELHPSQDKSELALLPIAIEFEPPLPEPGALEVAHESGWLHSCVALPSGVDLLMPEGPASLVLRVAAGAHERTIKVAPDAEPHVWRWRR